MNVRKIQSRIIHASSLNIPLGTHPSLYVLHCIIDKNKNEFQRSRTSFIFVFRIQNLFMIHKNIRILIDILLTRFSRLFMGSLLAMGLFIPHSLRYSYTCTQSCFVSKSLTCLKSLKLSLNFILVLRFWSLLKTHDSCSASYLHNLNK